MALLAYSLPDLPCPNRHLVFLRLEHPPRAGLACDWIITLVQVQHKALIISSLLPSIPPGTPQLRICNTPHLVRDIRPTEATSPTYSMMSQPALWTDSAADLHQTAIDL